MSLAFLICLVVLIFTAVIGTPISLSMIVASISYLLVSGQDLAISGEQILTGMYDSYVLLAVPLFIVSANIMNAGNISDRLLQFCVAWVGRFRGGLGHVNIVSSLIFSGMSGSAVADAAGIGKVIMDMMTKNGRYSQSYAAALTAASATIGPIIPPSIPMMLYALISDQSLGYLFLGGVIPGLLFAVLLMILNSLLAHRHNIPREKPVKMAELPRITLSASPALMLPAILLLLIYTGWTTPTEAAAVSALYALFLAGIIYRSLSWHSLYQTFSAAARSSAAVGLVIGGSLVLNYVVASENIPMQIQQFLTKIDVGPLMFLIVTNILVLFLGAFLDSTTIILIILPLFIPACQSLGIDLVHFGVIIVVNFMIGLITPPYGMLLFVINAVTDTPLAAIIRQIWIFIVVLIIGLIVLIFSPDLVLWLPRLAGYQG